MTSFGSALSRLFKTIPGHSTATKLIWLWHFLTLVALIFLVQKLELPESFLSDALTPKPNKFSHIIAVGLWRGGLIHIAISTLILLTIRWWDRKDPATLPTQFPAPEKRPQWFWPLLSIILVSSLFLRWPRMDDSYWGDEGQALRFFAHGKYFPLYGHNFQGPLKFEPVRWTHVFWDDQTGGNHYLFSIIHKLTTDAWRSFNGLPIDSFSETVSRLPLLLAGLGSIIAIALFLSWLGRPRAGLIAALYLAVHPWHIRYSTEARGYVLMLLFFILAIWALLYALRSGTWKSWVLFAITELLAIYSWKIAILPFAAINGCLILWLLLDRRHGNLSARFTTVIRLMLVNLTAGAVFVFLVMPCTLQSPRAVHHIKGKPMDQRWLDNCVCGIFTGNRWHRDALDNPTEQPLSEIMAAFPLTVGFGLASFIAMCTAGVWIVFRTRPEQGIMLVLVILSALVGMCIFKWFIRIEWIYWYSFFTLLPLSMFTGLGLDAMIGWASKYLRNARKPMSKGLAFAGSLGLAIAPAASFALTLPQTRLIVTQPNESYREAFELTRGKHEPLGFTGPSNVITCYPWRHIESYDPRADWHVGDAKTLEGRMSQADSMNGHLYFIVGQRDLFADMNKDIKVMLENPQLFEKIATLWAQEDIHTKEIYHYLGHRPATH